MQTGYSAQHYWFIQVQTVNTAASAKFGIKVKNTHKLYKKENYEHTNTQKTFAMIILLFN